MNKKGFTLIELLIVIIVIGILATVAVPQYLKATERAKIAKAKTALGLIANAEKMYRGEKDIYTTALTNATLTNLEPYIEMTQIIADPDWDYSTNAGTASAFTATATRVGGNYNNQTITMDQDGAIAGTHALK
ncbi:MAG: prepilin-type N-terminal cleavage/methylation domain-containing protein [Candidatus Omnitrophica bacterium]|nr:prepilin-type N-terminal cleavage/methylation domain-containing protein [Candidatus Omnitrophota bacterium]